MTAPPWLMWKWIKILMWKFLRGGYIYFIGYTQYGPITNGGIRARSDATIRYRTILHVRLFQILEYCDKSCSVDIEKTFAFVSLSFKNTF